MIRPKYLNVKNAQSITSYCLISLLLVFINVIHLFAMFFDFTMKIIVSFCLFLFFFILIPIDIYKVVKKSITGEDL